MSSFLLKTERSAAESTTTKVDRFLKSRGPSGRLIFALDATGSRLATWDLASGLQAEMFREAARSADSNCRSSITAASGSVSIRSGRPMRSDYCE